MIMFAKKYLLSGSGFKRYYCKCCYLREMKAKPGLIQKQLLQVVWLAKKYWFFLSHEAEMNCGDKSVNPSICSLYLSEDLAEKVNYGSEGFKFMFFFSIL